MTPSTVAIVLAAGVGSRLRPHTDNLPKCLVPIGAASILERAVNTLESCGIQRLIVSTGYLDHTVREALASARIEVAFVHNPDFAETQNVVSFERALHAVRPGERVVKIDGDVLFERTIIDALWAANTSAVAVDRSQTLGAEEMKVLTRAGKIARFGKTLDPATAHGESIGIECFLAVDVAAVTAAMSAAIHAGRTNVYYEDVYNDVVERVPMTAVDVSPRDWTEIDDADDLARAIVRFGGRD